MKKILLSSLITSFLFGCSSAVTNTSLETTLQHSGGHNMGDATSLYWFTERLAMPISAADYVVAGDYGWYQSNYRWEDGNVRELIREGEQLKNNAGLVKYSIHVRFNREGDAVYQQYRLGGKVLPMNSEMLEQVKAEAINVAEQTKRQNKAGTRLFQGYWDGSEFETCAGQSFASLEFNQTLPNFVVSRLADIDSYVAFVGERKGDTLLVEQLLMLTNDNQSCVERPQLLQN
ncbi:DUF1481 domain-containing protein [Vibrio scophthalmi]|uniref:DUF1481 domain-containing protein n=1 Tax=Vibrio scophthalmi TaxID=45658 RepID=UPI000849E2F4|nr:DUF1481 domain-containing protein [Vibrio scophthalmi]